MGIQSGTVTPLVEIYEDNAGNPGTLHATLSNPATVTDSSANTFTATNTTLSATTTYWLVTSNSATISNPTAPGSGFGVSVISNTTADTGAATGWSIGNGRFKSGINQAAWANSSNRILFTIRGTLGSTTTTNAAPTVATEIPDQTAMSGTVFSYQVPAATFADADAGDTLTYAATLADDTPLPAWLSFTAATRTFSGTPTAAETVSVKVTASDASDSVSDTFDIVVGLPPDTSPTLVSNAGQGENFQWSTGADRSQPFTTGAAGATLSSVEIISKDAEGDDAAVSLCTVDGSNHPTSPCTALTAPSSFAAGTLVFRAPANTTLAANTTYSVLITSPGREGLRLDATPSDNEDAGAAMGWSIANTSDIHNIVTDTWSVGSSIRSLRITIKGTINNAPTVATEIPNQTAMSGTVFSYQVPAATFADADGDTLTYTATLDDDSMLPSWLSFDAATRTFSGTPTTAETVSVKVTASDASESVSDTFDIVVGLPPGTAMTLVSNAGQGNDNSWNNSKDRSQPFTTGAAGATLSSVEIISEDTAGDEFAVSLCMVDGSGYPTSDCTPLTVPSSFAAGTLVFTAPDGTTLAATTTYSLLITSPGVALVKLDATSSDNEDAGGATGWSIADAFDSATSPTVWTSITTALRITIKGTLNPATNNAPTGEPTISGTARVGRTLTASTTGITDADGLTSPTYTYQWIRANGTDADIASANSSTYTLVGADLGKTIKVKVSFTDDASNTETLTSAAYPSSGTVQANNVLVSNVGQTQSSIFSLATFDLAQSFRTGANATGYTLTSIELRLDSTNSTNTPAVKLYSGSANGTLKATFTGPAMLDASSVKNYAFTPSSAVILPRLTTYWVVAEGATDWTYTLSTGEDGTSAMGWSIGDNSQYRNADETGNFLTDTGNPFLIHVTGTLGGIVLSSDATLSALVLEDASDNSAITISPPFASGTTSYTASVGNGVDEITIAPTVNESNATVEYLDSSDAAITDAASGKTGQQVSLSVDANTIKVKVTAEDTTTTDTYTVVVTRAAAAPMVTDVDVTSSPDSGDTYGTSEMILFTVTFDQAVMVTGTPEFEFCLGTTSTASCNVGTSPPARRRAALSSGSGTTALVFGYTVVVGDVDDNGIWIGDQDRTIKLETGDTIQGTVSGLDAVLTHLELGEKTGHKVNGASSNTAPTVATEIPDQTAMSGTAFSYQVPAATFTDADSDTLTYAATLADDTVLPSWLSFDPATRTFSGTPTAAETVSVKVTASDASDSVSDTFDIVVSAATGICSRTAEVQTALLTATGRAACADVTAADLVAVTSLTVSSYSGTSLDPADFAGLTGLTSLTIASAPQLTTVPDNAFAGATALTSLSFRFTGLTTLAEDAFDGLTALESLNIAFSNQLALDADAFNGLTALDNLSLANNRLTTLDADAFNGLTTLRILDLSANLLTTLDADIFDGLTALESLELQDNRLTTLDADIFDGLTALIYVFLSANLLTTLDADIFDGLTALQEIWLDQNSLDTLDANLFDGLTALRILGLSVNGLTTLEADIFDDLTAMETLLLSSNLLTTLEADLFDGLTALETLKLDQNSLDTLDADIFDGLTALTRLELQDNRLTALDANIFDGITGLQWLDLKCNYFTALDLDIFDPFAVTLTYLNLQSDSFTTTPTDAAIQAKFTIIVDFFTTATTCSRVTVSPTPLTVTEGASGTLSVALRSQPFGEVTVAISSDNTDVTVAPTTPLTFTAANWDTAQTVTVSAAQDTDEADESATLILDPSGSNYDFVNSTALTVTVTDDDDPVVTTLVSNAGQGEDSIWRTQENRAQAFTTSAGATLSSVEITSEDVLGDDVAVSLCTVDGSNLPTSPCTVLTAPSSFAAGTLVFTAPANTTLAANTTYSLLVVSPGADNLALDATFSDNEDAGGATDWSIANTFYAKNFSNVWVDNNLRALRITIKGTLSSSTNSAPTVATEIPDQTATTGTVFNYAFPDTTFTDADSDTLTYTATLDDDTVLPSWLSFDPATRTFSGTPTAVETVSVKVTASDGNGGSVSDTFDIVVSATATGICSRTAEVQTALLAATSRTACADVTAADLVAVTSLTVNNYSGTVLDPADFAGLTGLTNLLFGGSPQLTTLPDNAFAGVTALTLLDFNSLVTVTMFAEDAFSGLTALENLNLSGNNLTMLDADIFDGLTSLRILNLSFTSLTTLAADIFNGLTALEEIDLSFSSNMAALDEDTFDGLTALHTLDLSFTALTTLDADIFDGLTALRLLSLSGNRLTTLDADIFDGLTALSRLELQGNRLTALDADIFDGLTALEQVYLSANLLTTLDADIFDGLTLLQEISLDRNSLDTLDADIFDGLTALQKLQLQDNRLTALHADIFDGLTVLELLDLNCNYFTALDFDIFDPFAATLTSLDLRSDSFTTPPTDAAIRAKFTNIDTVFTGSWTCDRVTVSPTSLTVTEGATGTLSVALRSLPTDDVTLAISSDNPDVTVTPTTALTFTVDNWDTAQTVTVSAAEDTDQADESATLILNPDGDGNKYPFVFSTALTVTVTDDDADTTAPRVASIARQNPTSSPTNADSLTWRVTFSEAVSNVDAADFVVSGTTATVTAVAAVSGVTGAYDVTASGGNLAGVSATVGLAIAASHNIQDGASNALSNTAPTGTNDNSYVVDNTAPTVAISGVPSASNAPFTATFTFSEAVTGFAVGDITLTNASVSNFTATSTTVYTALVTPTASGTVTVNVSANAAQDAVGNGNTAASLATTIYTPPAITITAGTSPVTEGTSAVFTLSRAGSTTAALTVNVTVSETGGDMVAASNEGDRTVTFLANAVTATLSVTTASDNVDEANSVVTATISADTGSPASYSVGTPASAMVTVEDNDTRDVTVSPTALPVNEGSTGTYTVVLNSQPTASVTVTPSRTGSSDVTFSPAPLTFTTSTWSMVQTVTVTAAQDSDAVDDSATISHAVTGGDYAAVTADSVVVTVDDDETADTTAPRVASITRQNPTVSPTNADSLTWRVTFSETVSNVNEADFVVSGTTATVTAVAAVSGVTGGYDVTTSGGNLASVNATVTLAIASSHNIEDGASNALSNTAPTGTNDNSYVVDNTAPSVTISGVPATSNAPFTATFTFSEAVTGFAVGDITLGNAAASSFTVTSTMVFTALITPAVSGTVTVDVSANAAQDAAGNGNTAAARATSTYTGTAALPAITIAAGASPVTEGTSAVFTLSRTGSTTAALTVNVTVSEAGGDMVAASNEGARTVTFLANSTTVTLSIATASDSVAEAHSVVTATISADTGSPASYSVGAPGSAMVTVRDDDSNITVPGAPTALSATAAGGTQINLSWTAPTDDGGSPIIGYKIEVSPDGNADWTELVANTGNANTTYEHIGLTVGTSRHYRVSAINSDGVGDPSNIDDATASVPTVTLRTQSVPESIGTAMLVVTLDQPASAPLSVPWYTLSSTAASPGDYTNGAGTLIIPSGVTNATISITIIDDAVEEPTETVLVLLSPGTGYDLGGSGATVSILDDDGDGPAPSGATVDGATVVLTYNEPLDGASTPSSTAFVLRVADNRASITEVSVDGSEVTLTLASPVPAGRTVSLDYTQPMSNPIQDASGNKAQSFARWYLVTESTITITNPVITVPGAPTALSARAVGETQINLSWTAPGENGGAPISGYKIESSPDGVANWTGLVANTGNTATTYAHIGLAAGTTRHYRVSAINSVGAGRPSNIDDAIASIPSLSLRTQSIPEGIGTAALLVTLNQPAGDPLSVPWYTLNGDAVSPGDYTAGVGQLIIPSGTTRATIPITIIDDADTEPTETVLVLLSPGEGYVLGGSGATVSILDDDGDGPAPSGATVNGTTVVLTYNKPLDGASTPPSSAFVLRVADNLVSVDEVSVNGSAVTLTLASPVPAGQPVSLDYTQPMSNPIQDGSGNKAQSFTRWYLVTGNTITGTVDTTAPTVTISGVPAISDAPFTATFTFSEAVTGFAVGDITLGNATASSFTSTSTAVYRALVTPAAAGAVTVDVPANAAQDAAGNGNTAATRASSTYTGSATRGVTVSATALTVNEGTTGTYTVVLDSQPTANVTVTPSRTGSSDVTFSPPTLTFTTSTWNTAQPVTVTAAQDSDAVDDRATISHAVTGGDYVGVTVESVVVRVNDDESVDTLPGVPTDLSASTGGNTRINLSWTAPGDDGGSPITGYKIEVSPDGNATWTGLVANTGNTTTTYAHIGLAVGTTRHYRVSAINSVGAGDPSNIDDATTRPITRPITGGGGGGGGGGPTPSDDDFEWNVKRDIEDLDGGNDRATGVWSDGTTLWVADNADGAGDAVYAYDLASGERVEEREFELDERNRAPRGIWSDRSVVWVSDSGQNRLFAYDLATGERLEEREFALAAGNSDARGIWSDEETMWVLDGVKDSLFVYDFESGELLAEYELDAANDDPRGIWSDGVTIWVSDHGVKRLIAYRLPVLPDAETDPGEEDADDDARELERVSDEEFTELSKASNNSPRGIWSDGDVMYVADESDDRVYTYNMPDAADARLASLTLSGVDIGEFDTGRTEYEAVGADGVTETTVEAAAAQDDAVVGIDTPDADGEADGHQVALQDLGEITVTVTSADGSRTKTYRVRLGEEEAAGPVAGCLRGDIAVGFSLVVYAGGSIEDLVACAEGRNVTALYVLDDGAYVSYIVGAPELVNRSFAGLFAEGLAALTPLIARSDGPASPDPSGDATRPGDATQPWPACLQGEIATGFNLVVYEEGSVGELEACAEGLGLAALYALSDGVWVSYIVGAPEFVNLEFRELFTDGVPALTPLVGKRDAP